MTDLSGRFDTVVLEFEAESMADWEQLREQMFQAPAFRDGFARTSTMVDTGYGEMYTIEGQG
jgi:hypothetical protein